MDTLLGLPAHPLFVHIPIVLGPLAAILFLATLIRPAWRKQLSALTIAMAAVAAVGAQLATGAGEALQKRLGEHSALLEQHAERGEMARNALGLFFVLLCVAFVLRRREDTRIGTSGAVEAGRAAPVLVVSVFAALIGLLSIVAVSLAGHSGARAAWCDPMKDCPKS